MVKIALHGRRSADKYTYDWAEPTPWVASAGSDLECDQRCQSFARHPRDLDARMNVLGAGRKKHSVAFESGPRPANIVALHPAVLERCAELLARLKDAPAKGINAGGSAAAEAMRDLVDTVTVFRDLTRAGVQVEIAGRLTALLGEQAYPNKITGVWGSMVAEARYSYSPPPDIAEFPLRFQSAPNRDARRFQPENASA